MPCNGHSITVTDTTSVLYCETNKFSLCGDTTLYCTQRWSLLVRFVGFSYSGGETDSLLPCCSFIDAEQGKGGPIVFFQSKLEPHHTLGSYRRKKYMRPTTCESHSSTECTWSSFFIQPLGDKPQRRPPRRPSLLSSKKNFTSWFGGYILMRLVLPGR